MWLAKPVIPGRTSSLALAASAQLFWAPLLSRSVCWDLWGACRGPCDVGQGISLACSLPTCCAEAPVVVAWHLVAGQVEMPLRETEQSRFLEAGALGLAEEGGSLSILAWSPVHLLQEGSGPPFEPPVRGRESRRPCAKGGREASGPGEGPTDWAGGSRRGLFEFSNLSLPPCPPPNQMLGCPFLQRACED